LAPNGAGSAVDGPPRSAMVSVDWFGVTGTWKQASLQREGNTDTDLQSDDAGCLRWVKLSKECIDP
jgi:hypothetical protein